MSKLTKEENKILFSELTELEQILERRKQQAIMDHIEADEFDYYLTDEDYATISEKLKDDIYDMFMGGEMEGFLEDHELYDSNFLIHLTDGDLDVCYKIWIENEVPKRKEDLTVDMIAQLDVFFWSADRDGTEWDREVDVDMSKIVF